MTWQIRNPVRWSRFVAARKRVANDCRDTGGPTHEPLLRGYAEVR